ncbi:type II toxin-antitoxin system ParD family antitoxin [Castellaniella caeni]|uniref:type II toxin-antitoxin system ParD family antitoxin n=1 Tax=Castellaniella caeni TaxID=266123 RepID=UPI000836CB92|nr:type II toxin-antitoxin system ParD family antitoxin [Castellaniella caeni]
MPTSVALSPYFENFVRQQVESGRFNNVSEVVRAGLRLLEIQEAQHAALREAIAQGIASGPGISADDVFQQLEAKYQLMTAQKDTSCAWNSLHEPSST